MAWIGQRALARRVGGVLGFLGPVVLAAFAGCNGGSGDDAADGVSGAAGSGADGSGGGSDEGGAGGADADGSGASGGTDALPLALADYCELRAQLYFDYLSACFGEEGYPESYRAEFTQSIEERCMQAESAIDDERLGYDPLAAGTCVADLEPLDCVKGEDRPSCEGVFEAQSEPGAECFPDETRVFLVGISTCRDGTCAGQECPGTCETLPDTGEDCSGACREGSYCASEICEALPAVGDSCEQPGYCADGAYCIDGECMEVATSETDACGEDVVCPVPTVCNEGTCQVRVGIGDPCQQNLHCPEPATCREGTCQAPGDEGASCTGDGDCSTGLYCPWWIEPVECAPFAELGDICAGEVAHTCAPGTACVLDDGSGEQRCRAQVELGGNCEDGFQLCPAEAYCTVDRVCEPAAGDGESCWAVRPCDGGLGCHCAAENLDDCATSQIDDGDTCQPLVPSGGPCFTHSECESGDCDVSASLAPEEPGVCRLSEEALCLP